MNRNLTPVAHRLGASDRARHYGHHGAVLWLTGLSASGKSTLSMGVEQALMALGYSCYVLDGDNLRHGLNSDLGFSPQDRSENIRRAGEMAALFSDAGLIRISAFISPYRSDRSGARNAARTTSFSEIYLSADLATCEARDPKGLYRMARVGTVSHFTDVSAPYEIPESPELIVDTTTQSVPASVQRIVAYVSTTFHCFMPKVARRKLGRAKGRGKLYRSGLGLLTRHSNLIIELY